MIIGHIGVAFAAKRRWAGIPLFALLVATFAPDIVREFFAAAGFGWRLTNLYSHGLPWSVFLAIAAGLLAWKTLADRTAGVVVGVLVMSHIGLDLISGDESRSAGRLTGLDVESFQQLEFAIETSLLVGGWLLLRRVQPRRWAAHWATPVILVVLEAGYLAGTISQRPYATRCLASPITACTERSWLTMKWETRPCW